MAIACDSAALSRAGGRSRNEDALATVARRGGGVWAVADGLGGHAGGDVAARVAADAAAAAAGALTALSADALASCVRAAHLEVRRAQALEPTLRSMRSTLALLAIDAAGALWAHVGDTRLYRFSGGRIVSVTRDHSLAAALGQATPGDEANAAGRNRLLRTLGEPDEPVVDVPPAAVPVVVGDAFLLCTDGWWDAVHGPEMEIDLAGASSPGEWLERMEDRLLARATGESDNYTAVAVWCADRAGTGA